MDLGPQIPVAGPERAFFTSLSEECNLLVYLLKDNLNTGATPIVVMYLATATATTGATWNGALAAALIGLLYQTLFDLVNQWRGVEEDIVNKPWRPIPQGLMTAPRLEPARWGHRACIYEKKIYIYIYIYVYIYIYIYPC